MGMTWNDMELNGIKWELNGMTWNDMELNGIKWN